MTWTGKQVYDEDGSVAFNVTRTSRASPYEVNLISGASVTSENLGDIVRYWMGPGGYGPMLQRLRSGALPLSPP